jgi:tripeptide aminopeptidase
MTAFAAVPADAEATELVLARTVALCEIPAPSFHEAARASVVAQWWRDESIPEVAIDAVGNVWGRLRDGTGRATVVCAHLDTVFDDDVDHTVAVVGDRFVGPGVGDDSVAVAALSMLHRMLPRELRHPVWILATVGEEGLGNLRGITSALDQMEQVRAVVALEGNYLGQVNVTGVGSVRWEVSIDGPGGHAWEASDSPSAIHCAAGLVSRIVETPRPEDARSSINIGTIRGGESVNSRAQRCVFQVDLRADGSRPLASLAQAVEQILDDVEPPLTLRCRSIGSRPAGSIPHSHPLVLAAVDSLRSVGIEPRFTAASTDANAAYARGVPAVTLGVTEGSGTHTEAEWIRVGPLASGLTALARTIAAYDEHDDEDR